MKSLKIPVGASFKISREITNLEKINLFFGYNGSGKTTISRVLNNYDKALVYNEDFIETNFRNSTKQKGIFTIGKNIGEAKDIIDKAINQKNEFEEQLNQLTGNQIKGIVGLLKEKENAIKNSYEQTVETLWDIKKKTDNHLVSNCLEGYKNEKKKLADSFIKYFSDERRKSVSKDNVDEFRLEIFEKAKVLFDVKKVEVKPLRIPKLDVLINITEDTIWNKRITGNKDNALFLQINELKNSDWVNQGRKFLNEQNICPFCQETLKAQFLDDLKDYFNESYELDIKKISLFKNEFEKLNIIQSFTNLLSYEESKKTNLEFKISVFNQLYSKNHTLILEKCENPSITYTLLSLRESYLEIAKTVGEINKSLLQYNRQIAERGKSQKNLKKDFWDCYTSLYEEVIYNYRDKLDAFKKESVRINDEITQLKTKIAQLKQVIQQKQIEITTLQTSIDSINSSLQRNGFTSFKIKKLDDDTCCIVRNGNDSMSVYKSLSEGEKTIITFLYFVELCKGTLDKNDQISNDKLIIIDDPISSLSHNIIFEVSQIIKKEYLAISSQTKYNQLFILTHNLYLFYEIRGNIDSIERKVNEKQNGKSISKIYNTYKVKLDGNGSSIILESKRDKVLTDYDVYWSIVKECKNANGYKALLPNAMRNILEYYFGFIKDEDNLNDALNNITDNEFVRFIQRNSHSDKENFAYNIEEINVDNFLKCFETIFNKTNQTKHYKLKMK